MSRPSVTLCDTVRVLAALPAQAPGVFVTLRGRPAAGFDSEHLLAHATVPAGMAAVLLVLTVEDARRIGAFDLPERVV